MSDHKKLHLGFTESDEDREQNDFYATDPEATSMFLKREKFYSHVLEPCCGKGHISRELEKVGYDVTSTDLYDYKFGISNVDFLDENNSIINKLRGRVDIVTNPPYKYAIPCVIRAIEICRNKVAMLFPLSYLPRFYFCKPAKLYVYPRRITIAKGGDFEKYDKVNMVEYGWFVWYKGYDGDTSISYIDNVRDISPKIQPYVDKANNFEKWNTNKTSIRNKIKELYDNGGISKREIARIVGVSEGCVRKWLKQME